MATLEKIQSHQIVTYTIDDIDFVNLEECLMSGYHCPVPTDDTRSLTGIWAALQKQAVKEYGPKILVRPLSYSLVYAIFETYKEVSDDPIGLLPFLGREHH